MARFMTLSEMGKNQGLDLKDAYDPSGDAAYGANGEKVGTVRDALVDDASGRIRYLIVDVGGWFSAKSVIVPVGMARIEEDAVYFDALTRDQVKNMGEYHAGMDITEDFQRNTETALTGTTARAPLSTGGYDYRDTDTTKGTGMFTTPQKLQLLEERLVVDKQRQRVGEVEIGKRVETTQANVDVTLNRDEVIIERHPVTDARPVDGAVTLGADAQTIRVDLEAEQANVRKQAYVTEEVEVSKRTQTETKTFTENVGREVLEVEREGDVRVVGDADTTSSAASSENASSSATKTTGGGRV
jgi:uncharacterized protein (TIGR02271 family)